MTVTVFYVVLAAVMGMFSTIVFTQHERLTVTVGVPSDDIDFLHQVPSSFSNMNEHIYLLNTTEMAADMVHLEPADIFLQFMNACRVFSNNTSSFISNFDCRKRRMFASLLSHVSLPNARISDRPCLNEDHGTDTIDFTRGYDHPLGMIEAIIRHQGWTKMIVIYDESVFDLEWLDNFVLMLGELNVSMSLHMATDDLNKNLAGLQPTTDKKWPYVLFCDLNTTSAILKSADAQFLRTQDYSWFVYDKEASVSDLLPKLKAEDNVATWQIDNNTGVPPLIETAAEALATAYDTVIEQGLWDGRTGLNGRCQGNLGQPARKVMVDSLRAMSSDTLACNNCTQYIVRSSITLHDGVPRMVKVAEWKRSDGLVVLDEIFPNAFNGFNNRTFRVATLEYSFFQKKQKTGNGTYKWVGLTFEILDELAKDLNFSYVVTEPKDAQWGIKDEDGNWTGMIAQVANNEVDFAAACFSITVQREEVVDFASPYFHEVSVVVTKRPQEDSKLFLYAYPFRWEVWLCMVFAIFLAGAALYVYTHHTPYYETAATWFYQRQKKFGIFERSWSFWYIFGALMQQGSPWMPEAQSGRMMVGVYWFFSIVVVATYTGNLIAFLAVNKVRMPFDTLADMAKQSAIAFGPAKGVAMVMLFKEATFEPYKSVAQNMRPAPSYRIGLEWTKAGNYAFIAEKSWYDAVSAHDCNLAMIREEFYPTNYGWAFQTGSPYLRLFSDRIDKMRETGLLDNWIQKWTPKNLQCLGLGPVTRAKVANLNDFQGGFYVLVCGISVGVIVLILECICFRAKPRKPPHANMTPDGGPRSPAGTSASWEDNVL